MQKIARNKNLGRGALKGKKKKNIDEEEKQLGGGGEI
jgi:hypothetical protein